MKSLDIRFVWRDYVMFNDAAKQVAKVANKREARRERDQRDKPYQD